MTLVLGIDPGKSGALVWLDADTKRVVTYVDMPQNGIELSRSLRLAPEIKFAVIEAVSAMTYTDEEGKKRGQGAAASFNFGFGAGMLDGALCALGIPIYYVVPGTWKALYGLSSDKSKSIELAKKKFPQFAPQLTLKKHDGRAEAALLALFGAERFK